MENEIRVEKLNLEEITEAFQNLRDAMIKMVKAVVEVVKKTWGYIKKFMEANPWIIESAIRKIKYNKKVANRNKLYAKRKTQGKS